MINVFEGTFFRIVLYNPTHCDVDVVKYSVAPNKPSRNINYFQHSAFSSIFHITFPTCLSILLIDILATKEIARLYPQLKLILLCLSELSFRV